MAKKISQARGFLAGGGYEGSRVFGVIYSYWHWCRTVRTARGPRQQILASFGKLDSGDLPGLLRGETPASVSRSNLAFLRERQARYLVGTPKSWLRAHEQTLLEHSDWKTVQDGLEVCLVGQPEGEPGERYVLCRSGARAEKERAMLRRQSERLTDELIKIDAWLRRTPQADQETVGRRIGRHLGKCAAATAIVVAEALRYTTR